MSATFQAAVDALEQFREAEHWIPIRRGTFQASYVAWLCGLAADKQAGNEDERAFYWLQHWRWLTAEGGSKSDKVLDRVLERLDELAEYPSCK